MSQVQEAPVQKVDPALIQAFARDGYVHVRGLIDPAEIDAHRAHVDEAVAWRTREDARSMRTRRRPRHST